MFPVLLIAIGAAVLLLGKRLAVLGAAVGALLGLGLLSLFSGSSSWSIWVQLAFPIVLAVLGFFAVGFAKGIVNIVLIVIGALAGAAIAMGFFGLFNISSTFVELILAVVGGVVGVILVQRFKDWAVLILAGLVGGLLVTRGLAIWLPIFSGGLGTLLVLILAGAGIAYQGGLVSKGKPATA